MKIIENRNGCANGKIYNVGNPANSLSVRELAKQMLQVASGYDEYRGNAAKVRLLEVSAADYYGRGYQDVEHRVPKIDNIRADLDWEPKVSMEEALRQIFDAYRHEIRQASALLE
jgi:nucleoside-diphosphate-sugar epimerase